MAKSNVVTDPTLLSAALEGLLLQRQRLDEQIASVRALLARPGGRRSAPAAVATGPRRRRALSSAARKRIAEAQKKRWAEYRKKQG